jgi:hypothetical protein
MNGEPVHVKLLNIFRRTEAVRRREGFVQAISRGIQVVSDRLHTVRRYSPSWPSVCRHPFRALDFIFFDPETDSHGRPFYFWREKPKDHVYPGAGIGFSLPPGRRLP